MDFTGFRGNVSEMIIDFRGDIDEETLREYLGQIIFWRDENGRNYVSVDMDRSEAIQLINQALLKRKEKKVGDFTFQEVMAREIMAKLKEAEGQLLAKINEMETQVKKRIAQMEVAAAASEQKIKEVADEFQAAAQKRLDSIAPRIDKLEKASNTRLEALELWRNEIERRKRESLKLLGEILKNLGG
ncbi:MAG: hypothetical protein DRI56_03190 [Chloroflexota bacterium]|nr:MAG: hypothetical protein DRI56_03190 [Chloroflexota bacterium]